MKRALFLWDIDGTLLRTGGAGLRAMRNAADMVFGDGLTWDGVRVSGGLDPVILADMLAANERTLREDDHVRFRDLYIEQLRLELDASQKETLQRMPGVEVALATLHRRACMRGDVMQGLVTGNYAAAAALKFRACGIDGSVFRLAAYGDEGPTRPDLVALALRRYAELTREPPDPRRAIIIGDTPRDIACAHAHGCFAFAVATGQYSMAELREAGADCVVADLSDPTPLFALASD